MALTVGATSSHANFAFCETFGDEMVTKFSLKSLVMVTKGRLDRTRATVGTGDGESGIFAWLLCEIWCDRGLREGAKLLGC